MVIVILAQSAATSNAYAMRYGDSFDENVDLIGLGLANLGAGISGTFVVNGSPTKTEMVDSAGGRSQISQLTAGLIVVVVLLFLTVPLSYMPNAVLASVVFLIGLRLIDVKGMRQDRPPAARRVRGRRDHRGRRRHRRRRAGDHPGDGCSRSSSTSTTRTTRATGCCRSTQDGPHRDHAASPRAPRRPRASRSTASAAGIYYANASRFTEEILELVEDASPRLRWLAVSMVSVGDIDFSGSDTVDKLVAELQRNGVTLVLCDVDDDVRAQLEAYDLIDVVGEDRLFASALDAVEAYRPAAGRRRRRGRLSRGCGRRGSGPSAGRGRRSAPRRRLARGSPRPRSTRRGRRC